MIKKASERIKEFKDQMRGGKGTIEITHLFQQEELTGKARLCAHMTVRPGCSIGLHQHDREEEIYYILKGKGVVVDDGVTSEVTVGDSILTGNGASHSIENTGEEDLEFFAVILLFD